LTSLIIKAALKKETATRSWLSGQVGDAVRSPERNSRPSLRTIARPKREITPVANKARIFEVHTKRTLKLPKNKEKIPVTKPAAQYYIKLTFQPSIAAPVTL